jgi:hypothetical protein
MPTGYTADVVDGKVTDFRTFALRCARAFGACVMQRDEPMDALPRLDPPSTWHRDRAGRARAKLAELAAMTPVEQSAGAAAEHVRQCAHFAESEARATETRNRCNAMLAAVVAWEPPTDEHAQMKTFMVEQLTMTRDQDGRSYADPPVPQTGAEWHAAEVAAAESDIAYCEREQAKELERHAGRQAWLDALYASLGERPVTA